MTHTFTKGPFLDDMRSRCCGPHSRAICTPAHLHDADSRQAILCFLVLPPIPQNGFVASEMAFNRTRFFTGRRQWAAWQRDASLATQSPRQSGFFPSRLVLPGFGADVLDRIAGGIFRCLRCLINKMNLKSFVVQILKSVPGALTPDVVNAGRLRDG